MMKDQPVIQQYGMLKKAKVDEKLSCQAQLSQRDDASAAWVSFGQM